MKPKTNIPQWLRLYVALTTRVKMSRTEIHRLGIADTRSRVSDIERHLGIRLERETVPGKKYLRYWIPKSNLSV